MPYIEFHRWILAAVLAMARFGGAFAICPALTESMIPGIARRAAVLGFAYLAIPFIKSGMPPGEPSVWMFAFLAFKEAFIGFLIGFFAAIPFWIAENVGNFIDNQRGATMGEVYSPLSGTQVSTTGIFFTQLVSTLFFVGGAVLVFLGALYAMLRTTVVIAAPVIIIMFLATLGLGLVNRTAPQLNVFFLSMPIKSALGIAMLVIYLPFIMDMLMYTKEGAILGPVRLLLSG
jgi:type III secretion protein T